MEYGGTFISYEIFLEIWAEEFQDSLNENNAFNRIFLLDTYLFKTFIRTMNYAQKKYVFVYIYTWNRGVTFSFASIVTAIRLI